MDITKRLEALAAEPKNWRCTTTYSDGKVQTLDQPRQSMAEAHADGKRRFLGKVVHIKEDGTKVTCDSVVVEYIGA